MVIFLSYINFQFTWTCDKLLVMHGISCAAQDLSVLCCELHSKTCLHKAGRPSRCSGFDKDGSRESLLYTWHVVLLQFSVSDWRSLCISHSKCQPNPAGGWPSRPSPQLSASGPLPPEPYAGDGVCTCRALKDSFDQLPPCSPGKLMRMKARQLRDTHVSSQVCLRIRSESHAAFPLHCVCSVVLLHL